MLGHYELNFNTHVELSTRRRSIVQIALRSLRNCMSAIEVVVMPYLVVR